VYRVVILANSYAGLPLTLRTVGGIMLMQPNAEKTKQHLAMHAIVQQRTHNKQTNKQTRVYRLHLLRKALRTTRQTLQLTPLPQILRRQSIAALHTLLHPVLRDTHRHRITSSGILARLPLAV
jgi:hypothetical protein